MSFGVGLILYVLGSVLIGICIWCIPRDAGASHAAPQDHGHH